ncbi:vitamin K epoxide reductase family protein [Actinoplanes sp. ATCC 53533]|uniref:vitamin K epoxide reductase family protein n=1 Tax=Actinoplanes sp. ATCC 53533 TaxID=1288362 RepID=UPI0018F54029|nr:vitamin K epoxide reductase family protein [Actinoplanes sp. ATCC 53533]
MSDQSAADAEPVPQARRSTGTGLLLLIAGLIGGAAAFTLAVEKVLLLKNPTYSPSCSINPILSCGSVMVTKQAEVFGFPNPFIGVLTFPVVVTIGVLALAKVPLPRWVWLGLNTGAALGVAFIHWLIAQSLYSIGALCPYCMVVWVVTVTIFWYVTVHNLRHDLLPVPAALHKPAALLVEYHSVVPVLWGCVIIGLIGQNFWDYWRTLFG